jgi:hypothetical protein
MDDHELRRIIEQAARAAEAAAPAMEQAARAAEAATQAMASSGVIDQAARAAVAVDRMVEQLARDAPAFNSAMDQLARNAVVFDRVLEQLARDAPTFNRLIEERARGIADEAVKRMDQGEPEESTARYVHEEIATHPDKKRWVHRGLVEKIVKFIAKEAALEALCELIRGWPF